MLGKSFKEFTTFKHHGNVDCATWTMDANNEDKHTATQTNSSHYLNAKSVQRHSTEISTEIDTSLGALGVCNTNNSYHVMKNNCCIK